MAEPLKNMYNVAFFERLCPMMRKAIPGFDCKRFIFLVFNNDWPEMELKQRVEHIARTLHPFLPAEYPKAVKLVVELATELRSTEVEQGFQPIFLPDYIRLFGLDHPEESFAAIEQVTQLVSAEFAIRPFLIRYPEKTMAQMLVWSGHPSASVRRLASEGCRPRLPWALGVPHLKKDVAPILPILENLKNDPSEYVRRSVANNLNDIAKDHPALVMKLASAWKGKTAETDWIIRHGCRTLLKRGDSAALVLQGFNPKSKSAITELKIAGGKVKIGSHLSFDLTFVNMERNETFFRLEYVIDYLTASGKRSRKVFKLKEDCFPPKEKISLSRRQSFQNFTTRKHFRGKHRLTIVANGKAIAEKDFLVI